MPGAIWLQSPGAWPLARRGSSHSVGRNWQGGVGVGTPRSFLLFFSIKFSCLFGHFSHLFHVSKRRS